MSIYLSRLAELTSADFPSILSFVPFTAFIIVVSETIASLSPQKLALLHSVLNVFHPVIEDSPSTHRLYDTCRRFYEFAEMVFAAKRPGQSPGPAQRSRGESDAPLHAHFDLSMANQPMSQAEWEDVMHSLEIELGDGASDAMAGDVDLFTLEWGS